MIKIARKLEVRYIVMQQLFCWQIRLWNLPKKKCVRTITAHDGYVRGLSFHQNGEYFFSVRHGFVSLSFFVSNDDVSADVIATLPCFCYILYYICQKWHRYRFRNSV